MSPLRVFVASSVNTGSGARCKDACEGSAGLGPRRARVNDDHGAHGCRARLLGTSAHVLLDVGLLNGPLLRQPLTCASGQWFPALLLPLEPPLTSAPLILGMCSSLCHSLGRRRLPAPTSLNSSHCPSTLSTLTLHPLLSFSRSEENCPFSAQIMPQLWHGAEPRGPSGELGSRQGHAGQLSAGEASLCPDAHPHLL